MSITSPTAGQTVARTITIQVQATDPESAAGSLTTQVSIDGGTWQSTTYNSGTSRYERALNTTTLTDATHTVTARATDGFGNTTTTTARSFTVNNNQAPTANAGGPYSGTAGSSIAVTGVASSDSDGTISTYRWDWGDGTPNTTSSIPTASHIYATGGTKTITLTVTDNDGATDTDTATANINARPNANAGGPYFGTAGVSITVNGGSSTDSDGTISTYRWNWGDGTSDTTSSLPTAVHTYATTGSKTITLTVTDNDGATDTDTATANISGNQSPTVSITSPTAGQTVSGTITIRVQATDPESAPGSLTTQVSIDGGTWLPATYNTFTSSYERALNTTTLTDATHTVTARATDGFGNTTTTPARSFTVNNNQAPTANAGGPYTGTAGVSITVNGGSSTDSDGTISTYRWNWGDGTPNTTNSVPTAVHTYTTSGTKTITLTVTDNDGATDTDTATASISGNQSPTVSISSPTAGQTVSGTITIRVQATDPESAAGSLTTQVRIDSGSWQPATYNTFTSSYERTLNTTTLSDATHTVTARATDGFGNTTTTTARSFTVNNNQAPTAEANGPYTGSTGSFVSFSSAGSTDSDGTIASYLWTFGDGTTSTAANPTHIYASGGTKTITLTVTDNDGATSAPDTTTAVINVTPVADAGGPYSGTAGVTVNVTGAASTDSDGSISTYAWSWGDGTTSPASTFAPAIHTYTTGGAYTITLTVTDDDGTTDSDTAVATIAANAAPTVSVTNPTSGLTVTGPLTARITATDAESAAGILTVTYSIDGGVTRTTTYNAFTTSYEGTVDTTALSDGSHSISAGATDGFGNTTTSTSVTFVVDNNKAPTAGITSPTSNTTVSGQVTITATATDDKAVRSVQFFVDGVSVGTDSSSIGGWSIVWNTTTATSGRHTLTATAADLPGKTGTSAAVFVTVDQPPTVDITRPTSLAVVRERITIAASADDDVDIDQVEFFVDGTSIGTDTNPSGGWSSQLEHSRSRQRQTHHPGGCQGQQRPDHIGLGHRYRRQ